MSRISRFHRSVRNFDMVRAGVLVALLGIGLFLTLGQADDDLMAHDGEEHSLVMPASGIDMDTAQLAHAGPLV